MHDLMDAHQRKFVYLRLSVTERCNFRCVYCLPDGYDGKAAAPELSVDEIRRLVRGFARMGVSKVRLTGGEPTTRRDLLDIARTVASVEGIRKVAITTNGNRLSQLAEPLREAGVSAINVSIDSLEKDRFERATGMRRFEEVLGGVETALKTGFESVKVNAVLMRGINDDAIESFLDWIRERPVSVRFIELMRTGTNAELFARHHLSAGVLQLKLLKAGWQMMPRGLTDGPAVLFRHPHYEGSVGLIAPYSSDFCTTCNRLRVNSQGALKLCLFGDEDLSLRDLLQADEQCDSLVARVRSLVLEKPVSHLLHQGNYGNTQNFSGIGG